MFVVTRLGGGNGRQPEQQTAATRSKMRDSSEEWRIGRMCRKAGGERLGAKVRNRRHHGSWMRESLKLPMARGQKYGVDATSPEQGRGRKVLGLPRSQRATGCIRKRRL